MTRRPRLVAHIREKIKTGDPRDRATVVGPMITAEALSGIRQKLDASWLRRGEAGSGGGRCADAGLEATVLEDVVPELDLCAHEAFAPVVMLHRYREFDEALSAFVNASEFGLPSQAFSRARFAARSPPPSIPSMWSGVLINQVPTFPPSENHALRRGERLGIRARRGAVCRWKR